MKRKILVIGSLNMDIVVEMARIPELGETVLGKGMSYIPGGKGANQACAAGKMGAPVKLLGCIGKDEFGGIQLQELQKSGVDVSQIKISHEKHTGTAVIYVDGKGNNNIVVVSGANEACSVDYLKQQDALLQDCDYVMFQMEIPFETVAYGIQRAKELGKTVILNPAPAPELLPNRILDGLDYITPNETELMKLCGIHEMTEESLRRGAEMLLDKGVRNVLVTMGEEGVFFADKKGMKKFPAFKVKAVDTTAAGDCFNGTFAAALASGYEKENAIRFAGFASSIAVTRKGAQNSIPELSEVLEKIEVYKEG